MPMEWEFIYQPILEQVHEIALCLLNAKTKLESISARRLMEVGVLAIGWLLVGRYL